MVGEVLRMHGAVELNAEVPVDSVVCGVNVSEEPRPILQVATTGFVPVSSKVFITAFTDVAVLSAIVVGGFSEPIRPEVEARLLEITEDFSEAW